MGNDELKTENDKLKDEVGVVRASMLQSEESMRQIQLEKEAAMDTAMKEAQNKNEMETRWKEKLEEIHKAKKLIKQLTEDNEKLVASNIKQKNRCKQLIL